MVKPFFEFTCTTEVEDYTPPADLARSEGLGEQFSLSHVLEQRAEDESVLGCIDIHEEWSQLLEAQVFAVVHAQTPYVVVELL